MIIGDINYPVRCWLEFTKGSKAGCGILWITGIYVNMHFAGSKRRASRLSVNRLFVPI